MVAKGEWKLSMRHFALLLTCILLPAWAAQPEFEQAQKLYQHTEYEASLKALQSIAAKDAEVYALMGRNYFMTGDFKKATECFDKAVVADRSNADYVHWLGRAYGRRAETSSPFTAPGFASKARQNFEKAVQMNPNNLEAASDLFEYYLEAPGFLGGGLDKAKDLAGKISQIDATEGHWAMARLAEKRKEFATAEQQLRRAAELAPHQVGRVLDLAKFLAKQGRYQEADQTFQMAEKVAPDSPKVMFAKANTYIQLGRNLDEARNLLKKYMSAKLTPDDPPRSEAAKLLKQVGS